MLKNTMVFIVNFNVSVSEVCRWMGLNPLKPKQLEAICKFVSGRDAFVALPTVVMYLILINNQRRTKVTLPKHQWMKSTTLTKTMNPNIRSCQTNQHSPDAGDPVRVGLLYSPKCFFGAGTYL